MQFSTVIDDKGYVRDKLALDLKSENCVNLISLKRNNSKSLILKRFRQMIFKARRRVKTTFFQFSEQLNMQRVLAKSMWELISWINNKILTHNICCFINKISNAKSNISKIKDLVSG